MPKSKRSKSARKERQRKRGFNVAPQTQVDADKKLQNKRERQSQPIVGEGSKKVKTGRVVGSHVKRKEKTSARGAGSEQSPELKNSVETNSSKGSVPVEKKESGENGSHEEDEDTSSMDPDDNNFSQGRVPEKSVKQKRKREEKTRESDEEVALTASDSHPPSNQTPESAYDSEPELQSDGESSEEDGLIELLQSLRSKGKKTLFKLLSMTEEKSPRKRKKAKWATTSETVSISNLVEKEVKNMRKSILAREEFSQYEKSKYDYDMKNSVPAIRALLSQLSNENGNYYSEELSQDVVRLSTLRSFLKGEAKDDFDQLGQLHPQEEEAFHLLPDTFERTHEYLVIKAEAATVIKRKMVDLPPYESLRQYTHDFSNKLIAQAEAYPDQHLRGLFLTGMPDLLAAVLANPIFGDESVQWVPENGVEITETERAEFRKRFTVAMIQFFTSGAITWMDKREIALKSRPNQTRPTVQVNKIETFNDMRNTGFKSRERREKGRSHSFSQGKREKGTPEDPCFRCGKNGHRAKGCPTPIKNNEWCRECDEIIPATMLYLRHHKDACRGTAAIITAKESRKGNKKRKKKMSVNTLQLTDPPMGRAPEVKEVQVQFNEDIQNALSEYAAQMNVSKTDFSQQGWKTNKSTASHDDHNEAPQKNSTSEMDREVMEVSREGQERTREVWSVNALHAYGDCSSHISLVTKDKQTIPRVLIDSGALTNKHGLISEGRAKELGLTVESQDSNVECVAANGTAIDLAGMAMVEVQLPGAPHNVFEMLEVHVVRDGQGSFTSDFILGRKCMGSVFNTSFEDDHVTLTDRQGYSYQWKTTPMVLFHLKHPSEEERRRPKEHIVGKLSPKENIELSLGEEEKIELKVDPSAFDKLKTRPSTLLCVSPIPIIRDGKEYWLVPRHHQVEVRSSGKSLKCSLILSLETKDHDDQLEEGNERVVISLSPEEPILSFTTDESSLEKIEDHPDGGEEYDDGYDIEGVHIGNPLQDTEAYVLDPDRARSVIGKELSPKMQEEFLNALMSAEVVFTGKVLYRPGPFTAPFHVEGTPRVYSSYPMPAEKEEALREYIVRYVKQGLLVPASFPVKSSAPVMVLKKPGLNRGYRIVIDYSKPGQLNSCLIVEESRNPDPRRVRRAQGHKRWKAQMDLKSGFFHIPIPEESRPHTTFMTPWGQAFSFQVLPQGASVSPAIMQRWMLEYVLPPDQFSPEEVTCYQDDILLESDTQEGLLALTRRVLNAFKEKGVVLSLEKCVFGVTEVEFLGRLLSSEKSGVPERALNKMASWPSPKNIKEIRGFLGFAGFYSAHVKDFSAIRHPLDEVIKSKRFTWNKEHEEAFRKIKRGMLDHPYVWNPDPDRPFGILTDASLIAAGAVAFQIFDGKPRAIGFYSKKFSERERRLFAVHELECKAILLALEHFSYLLPPDKETYVYSDSKSLLWLRESTSNRLLRLSYQLRHYRFKLMHIEGTQNPSDFLSRPPKELETVNAMTIGVVYEEQKITEEDFAGTLVWHVDEEILEDEPNDLNPFAVPDLTKDGGLALFRQEQEADSTLSLLLKGIQEMDTDDCKTFGPALKKRQLREGTPVSTRNVLKRLRFKVARCKVIDGVLYYRKNEKDTYKIWVPETLRGEVIYQMHDALRYCHFGAERTEHRVRRIFFWEGLSSDVRRYVAECIPCRLAKSTLHHKKGLFRWFKVQFPMQLLVADLMGPIEKLGSKFQRYVLVVVDAFSNMHWYIPIDKPSTKDTISGLLKSVLQSFNVPRMILTDRGSNFGSREFKKWCKRMGIQLLHAPARRHQASGKAERAIRELKLAMTTLLETHEYQPEDWDILTLIVATAHNSSMLYKKVNITPYQIMYGSGVGEKLPSPLTVETLAGTLSCGTPEHVKQVTKTLESIRAETKRLQDQINSERFAKLNADRCSKEIPVGATVVRKYTKNKNHRDTRALRAANDGPYEVVDRISPTMYAIFNDKEVYEQHISELTVIKSPENNDKEKKKKKKKPLVTFTPRSRTLKTVECTAKMGEKITPLQVLLPRLTENGKVLVSERLADRQTRMRNIESIDAYSLERYLKCVMRNFSLAIEIFKKKSPEEQELDTEMKSTLKALELIEQKVATLQPQDADETSESSESSSDSE